MKKALPIVSLLGLLGSGAAVTWSVLSRPDDSSIITHEAANSFNLQTGPAPSRAPGPRASGETFRDAVGAASPIPSSLTRPIATSGMAVGGVLRESPKTVRYTVITPKAEAWAKKHPLLAGLIAKPAAFLLGRSALGNARALRSFLGDSKKIDAYMNSTLVRITLNSPTVAKALVGNPAVIRAVLAAPALRDPQTVRLLLSSRMLRKMLDCSAIQEVLGDPEVMQRLTSDPETVRWISAHPQALTAIVTAVPALGEAFGAK